MSCPTITRCPADCERRRCIQSLNGASHVDSVGRRRRLLIPGIEGLDDEDEVRTGFNERSVLEGDADKSANAAQIDRRARADAELLAELLRSRGFYDAVVEPSIEVAGSDLQVQLTATPGPLKPWKKATGQKVSRARGSATNHKKNPGKRAHKGGS